MGWRWMAEGDQDTVVFSHVVRYVVSLLYIVYCILYTACCLLSVIC